MRAARDALVAVEDLAGARARADRVVATLDATPAGATADDVLALASIEAALGALDAAEQGFLRAVAMLEAAGGESSPELIAPYHGLGRTYLNAGRFPEARGALEQARGISQRVAGLFNVEQTPLIDDLTIAHLGQGSTVAAHELQLARLDNAVRRFGATDVRTIPYYMHLGDYYDQSRMRASARRQLATVLEIQETEYGPDDPRVLGTLRRILETDLKLGQADETKERLAALIEDRPPADPVEHGLTLAALGDWAVAADEPPRAREYYAAAYTMLASAGPSVVAAAFGAPRMLDFVPPLSGVDRGTRARRMYLFEPVALELDIAADGRALDVRVAQPSRNPAMDDAYVRRMREAHFRPRLVAGEPARTDGVRFTHYYRAYATDEDRAGGTEPDANAGADADPGTEPDAQPR